MHKETHIEVPTRPYRPAMLSKAKVLKSLRDQRQILVNSPFSALAQGGVLELDRAIRSIERMG